ncbi:unannotated protein [freshwater metagenome]|uniref:Unannotated protein n=1 Tax=freshwater metagenome TaxID=449393 RepID=A0A6J6E1Q3_9ZZZZ
MSSGNDGLCGTCAINAARRRAERSSSGVPSTRIRPSCFTSPATVRNSDDFPAPFGPMRHNHSPGRTVSENADTAVDSPYLTEMFSNVRDVIAPHFAVIEVRG